jgi:hypothetical protein
MPYNRFQKAKEILEKFKEEEMGLLKLRNILIRNVGSDERTISSYLKLMIEMRLIKEISQFHFKIL